MGRIFTGIILVIGWLLLLLFANYPFFCLVVMAGGSMALYEFLRMSFPAGERKYFPLVLLIGILPLAAAALRGSDAFAASLFLALLILIFVAIMAYPTLDNGLLFVSRVWFGVFYVGFCSAHLILLHAWPEGVNWLLVLTAVTAASDTGAYYVGRILGKTKLYPALSPGKTRAGAVGGMISGMVGGLLAANFLLETANLPYIALLSLVLSVIGIIGDLIESLIKRVSGVKDSGRILPGHGGVLDRCDSLLLTAPALYYSLYWGHTALLQ